MIPIFPLRATSIMSPPLCGCKRTRSPTRNSSPLTTTNSNGLVFQQLPLPFVHRALAKRHAVFENAPAAASPSFRESAAPVVAVPYFFLLGVSHGENAQRQNFVDFQAVAQIAGALRRNLRIIVENNRRAQHQVLLPLVSRQHRPRAGMLTFRGSLLKPLRRIEERDELASRAMQNAVNRNHRPQQHLIPASSCADHVSEIPNRQPDAKQVLVRLRRLQLQLRDHAGYTTDSHGGDSNGFPATGHKGECSFPVPLSPPACLQPPPFAETAPSLPPWPTPAPPLNTPSASPKPRHTRADRGPRN